MIWFLRIYLFLYFILYFGIGAWAVIEPVREILEFDIPSFMLAVGLSVSAPIGYSEVATSEYPIGADTLRPTANIKEGISNSKISLTGSITAQAPIPK